MVLDASPIVAVFKQEPGFEILERKIDEANRVLVGAPTLFECAMVLSSQGGMDYRRDLDRYVKRINARIVEFSDMHYVVAVDAFLRYGRGFNSKAKLNFGDCMSYAVASVAGDSLLFVGNDFTHTDIIPA